MPFPKNTGSSGTPMSPVTRYCHQVCRIAPEAKIHRPAFASELRHSDKMNWRSACLLNSGSVLQLSKDYAYQSIRLV